MRDHLRGDRALVQALVPLPASHSSRGPRPADVRRRVDGERHEGRQQRSRRTFHRGVAARLEVQVRRRETHTGSENFKRLL